MRIRYGLRGPLHCVTPALFYGAKAAGAGLATGRGAFKGRRTPSRRVPNWTLLGVMSWQSPAPKGKARRGGITGQSIKI